MHTRYVHTVVRCTATCLNLEAGVESLPPSKLSIVVDTVSKGIFNVYDERFNRLYANDANWRHARVAPLTPIGVK